MDIKVTELNPHPLNSKIYAVANIAELAEDIQKSGWIKPLTVVRQKNAFTIVSGHRRHQAAILLNLDVVPCEVVEFEHDWQILERLLLENQYREKDNATKLREYPFQKQVEAERAKSRRVNYSGDWSRKEVVENFPPPDKGKARDKAAETVGIGSGKTAEKGFKVIEAADALRESGEVVKADLLIASVNKSYDGAAKLLTVIDKIDEKTAEELEDKIATGQISVGKALNNVKKIEKIEKVRQIEQQLKNESPAILDNDIDIYTTDKKFNIIYADPAWSYWEGGNKNQSLHYSTMSIEEICDLPVKRIAANDCILFIWVTYPILKEAFDVIKSWGFEYSTCGFCWVKSNKKSGTPFFGNGAWTRANSELCLIAKKGSITRLDASISQVLQDPIMEHSRKPYRVRKLITQLVGELPRIELFSRSTEQDGWYNWGNKI
jgi:N6-adenosine-specific RNA methylase IME4